MTSELIIKRKSVVNLSIVIIGLFIYFSLYAYILNLFSKIGMTNDQYLKVLFSFDSKSMSMFYRELVKIGTLSKFIEVHQINLVNPFIFGPVFTFLSIQLVKWINEYKKKNVINTNVINMNGQYLPIIIALFDFSATSLILISTNKPFDVPDILAKSIGAVNLVRYIVLFAYFFWLLTVFLYICTLKLRLYLRQNG